MLFFALILTVLIVSASIFSCYGIHGVRRCLQKVVGFAVVDETLAAIMVVVRHPSYSF
jgi:hypothetical protein